MPEPTVPNWIPTAHVLFANASYPITEWRATRTQVVVKANGHEYRYYLNGLREVGQRSWNAGTRLVPADDPQVARVALTRKLNAARNAVLAATEKARLQDTDRDLDSVLTKLEDIRQAVVRAQASLAELS